MTWREIFCKQLRVHGTSVEFHINSHTKVEPLVAMFCCALYRVCLLLIINVGKHCIVRCLRVPGFLCLKMLLILCASCSLVECSVLQCLA